MHECKLSYLRSKQVSNYNLYKLGKRRGLHELIVGNKFEPLDSWLSPHYDSCLAMLNKKSTTTNSSVDPRLTLACLVVLAGGGQEAATGVGQKH